ncbi:MAG: OmpA family protein [Proteobacteria bacterium]|nr:OmpA family protein [Pseudomonadota bacterium]
MSRVGGTAASGDASAASLMISGYYDFFREHKIRPYLGAGVGVAIVDADGVSPFLGSAINDDDIGFAYQGMAGIAYSVSPRTTVTLGYRYFAVPDLSFRTTGGASVDADYASHEIMLGVRFAFGAPKPMADPTPMPVAAMAPTMTPKPAPPPPPKPAAAPAPKPQPAPAIVRNFLVFFDWDKANLTSLAQNIVSSAAAEAKRVVKVRLSLTGHADRSGTTKYNQLLSTRRANAVRQRLQQLGIAASDIAVFAKGESEPLVSTADGVREPQNRRVEIILE